MCPIAISRESSAPEKTGTGSPPNAPRLVVIGNFDGVHLGHQAVLRRAEGEALAQGLLLTVLTFDPHPAVFLARQTRKVLTLGPRKISLLKRAAPSLEVVVQTFDANLAGLTPDEFARKILKEKLNASLVVVGENFRFGKGRSGDLATLRSLGKNLGFDARSEALHGDGEGAFSSTRIRSLVEEGKVSAAAHILGRPHFLSGQVVQGDQKGRALGFPTANLKGVPQLLPAQGVYAVFVFELADRKGGLTSQLHGDSLLEWKILGKGVAHIGVRPTLERPESLEVHLIDFRGELYGKTLGISLIESLRGVEKFPSLPALIRQIEKDVEQTREILSPLSLPENL